MKKYILVILIAFFTLSAGIAFAARDDKFKEDFYDAFLKSFFIYMRDALIKNQIPTAKVDKYIVEVQARVDVKELEKMTWPCLSKLKEEQLILEGPRCMTPWSDDFLNKNVDLLDILK